MGMDAQAPPPVRRHQFTTTDPDHAHAFIQQSYSDHSVRLSGGSEGFTFTQTVTSSPSFSVGRMHYGLVGKVRFESLGGKLV